MIFIKTATMKLIFLLGVFTLSCLNQKAQNVGINTDHLPPDSSAMLDVRNPKFPTMSTAFCA